MSSLKKGAHTSIAFVEGQFRRKRVLDSVVWVVSTRASKIKQEPTIILPRWETGPVVEKLDNASFWINVYRVVNTIGSLPLDSDLFGSIHL